MTKGPSAIITEDPTCAAWNDANPPNALRRAEQTRWDKRDPSVPAIGVDSRLQRSNYETVGQGDAERRRPNGGTGET